MRADQWQRSVVYRSIEPINHVSCPRTNVLLLKMSVPHGGLDIRMAKYLLDLVNIDPVLD